MTRNLVTLALLAVLLVALVAVPAFSKGKYEHHERVAAERSNSVITYSLPSTISKLPKWGDIASPEGTVRTTNQPTRVGLGTALSPSGISSPGFSVIESYNDDQMFPGGNRQVDFRGSSPSVHFTYGSAKSTTQPGKFGYNVYDPIGAVWPRGAGVGCEIQAADAEGWWNNMDMGPQGYIIIAGNDDASGTLDNHFFYQTMTHGCFWGTGSQIPPSQYNVNFLTPSHYLAQLRVEVQEVGSDTVVHCLAVESASTNVQGDLDLISLHYFRKASWSQAGTWTGPTTLDSINRSSFSQDLSNGSIAASRVSDKLLVAYTHFHELAWVNNQRYDVEVYFRVSDDAGLTWGPPVNMTNYSRIEASYIAFINTHSLIDSEDGLHIIWTACPMVANAYEDPTADFGDFTAALMHWTDRVAGPNAGGTITRAHNAEWGRVNVCGYPSPGLSWIGYESIAECNGRLYCFASQYLDAWGLWGVAQTDDCASGFSDQLFAANGEVFVTVSTTLDGLLWDAARNLTKSYTPDCDSAGYGGVCMNDGRATVSRFGQDSAAYGADLYWPGGELVVPDNGTWPDPYYLHLFYTEDHYPAPGWRSLMSETPADYNMVTLNPLKWMRIPCVDPIPAAWLSSSPSSLGYPQWVKHTAQYVETINVTNDGNVPLNVTAITDVETSPTSDWLSVSETSLSVPAGVDNQRTFDLTIDGTVIGAPGTVEALNGFVELASNATNIPFDTILIIDFLVIDTMWPPVYDTVTTYNGTRRDIATEGDFTVLVVSTGGELGYSGLGEVNLDFTTYGGECNPSVASPGTNVYMFSSGPLLVRNDGGGSYATMQGMWEGSPAQPLDISSRRLTGASDSAHIVASNYEAFFTGTSVNPDSSIAFERTVYAPTGGGDSTDFMIVKTDFWSNDGVAHSALAIGEGTDWDIPADDGANNTTAIVEGYQAVYQRGIDTATAASCQDDSARFGATGFLGMHTAADTAGGNECAGTCEPYGAYTMRNDSLFAIPVETDSLGRFFWEKMGTYSGLNAEADDEDDLFSVVTAVYDYTMEPGEKLTTYLVVTSVRDGTLDDLKANLDAAFKWYNDNLRPGCTSLCGCCVNLTGNVDNDPEDICDIGDLTKLIDFLFISYTPPVCMEEANCDGSSDGVVDMGDLTKLIDFLFISYNPPAPC
ncbi:MAG: exo-alpha-sialidase [Candidatus Zixiibacteriota bacterium]|nr:MAG: exo-alpha-sialidase [candidate division Zixibacteria bacterium]